MKFDMMQTDKVSDGCGCSCAECTCEECSLLDAYTFELCEKEQFEWS